MTFWKRRNVVLCFIIFYRRFLLSNVLPNLYLFEPKKKMEKQGEFPTYKMLKTCSLGWRCEITALCSGEIKTKAPITIYHGGERKEWRGIAWFSGEQRGGGETVIANRVQRGGGTIRHWLPMRGVIKIPQWFRGGTRLISVWYNKNPPSPPPS